MRYSSNLALSSGEAVGKPQGQALVPFALQAVLSVGVLEIPVVLGGHGQRHRTESSSLSHAELLLNHHRHLESMFRNRSSILAGSDHSDL